MKQILIVAALATFFLGCKLTQKLNKDDGKIAFIFLQMNDVYEISALEDGKSGGLARVANLRQQLLRENPNVITIMAGDFISPSVTGTLKFEGTRIRGRQMIESLNAVGVDFVNFGNHEFDYDLADLQARIDESNFTWISGNVRQQQADDQLDLFKKSGETEQKCPVSVQKLVRDADGTTVNLGIFSTTIDAAKKDYVHYEDWKISAVAEAEKLKNTSDLVIGITHIFQKQDEELATALPFCPLIMGGHDHNNMRFLVGNTVVAKADANAKTVYVHRIFFDKRAKKTRVESQLVQINETIAEDSKTAEIVRKWENIANNSFESSGFRPKKLVKVLTEPLDCRDFATRNAQMPIGKLLTNAMLSAARTKPEVALFNSGSMRVDDIFKSSFFELDVLRLLPFGGGISEVEMTGKLLRRALTGGNANRGRGGFLQINGAEYVADAQNWQINGQFIQDLQRYRVVLPDFLLSGAEQGLEFLKASENLELSIISKPNAADKLDLRNDIRLIFIDFLSKN